VGAGVLDHNAAVHDDVDASGFGAGGGFGVDDSLLDPDVFEAEFEHLVDYRGNEFRKPEDVDYVGLDGEVGEAGVGFFAQDGLDCGVDRQDAVALFLHVRRDVVAGLVRVVGETDNSYGARLRWGVAEHVSNDFGFVHLFSFRRLGLFVPDAEESAENNKLTEMISGVVGDEKRLAKEVLAVAPAEGFEEIGFGLGDEGFELLKVFANGGNGRIPGVRGGWLGRLGPVFGRPLERVVAAGGRRGEVEDVALSDAEVLDELPGGVGEIGWDGAAMCGREIFDGFVEADVGLASAEESDELLAEFGLLGVGVLGRVDLLRFAHADWMREGAAKVTLFEPWMSCDVVFFNCCWEVTFAAHAEVAADEGLEIAVEDFVHVAYFYTGAEVFGHAVGLQDVAANL
jgi:hypothetical protein